MQMIAQQWLVYRLTGSPAMLGLTSFVTLIPLIPLSLWAGSVADRWPKRNILVATQAAMMLQALLLAGLVLTGVVTVWHVILLALALGIAQAIDTPARQSIVVEFVDDRADLTNAISLNSSVFQAGRAIGPALAGVAVATTGEGGAFLINALSFVPVIIALVLMRLPDHRPPARPPNVAFHMLEGLSYVRRNDVVLAITSIVAISAFLSMPYTTLLPVFAQDLLHDSASPVLAAICAGGNPTASSCQSPDALTYGLLQAAGGVGAVLGALFLASMAESAPRGRWLTAGNLVFPAALVAMSLSRDFFLSCLCLFVAGFCFVAQNILANTLIQITVEDDLRGRVMSVYSLAFQGMMRLGGLQAGLVAQAVSAPVAVGTGAIISLIYGLALALRFPKLRRLR